MQRGACLCRLQGTGGLCCWWRLQGAGVKEEVNRSGRVNSAIAAKAKECECSGASGRGCECVVPAVLCCRWCVFDVLQVKKLFKNRQTKQVEAAPAAEPLPEPTPAPAAEPAAAKPAAAAEPAKKKGWF